MAGGVVGKVASQIALFGNHFQAAVEVSGDWHIKQLTVLTFATILLNDAQGYVQQLDMAFRLGLLTGDVSPLAAVLLRDDVVLCQIRQVSPPDARESRKDEQVPRVAQSVRWEFRLQQFLKLLARQVAVFTGTFSILCPANGSRLRMCFFKASRVILCSRMR